MAQEIKSLQLVEPPYFPFKGVNVDSNGLAIDAEECSMCMNLDINATELTLRAGSISLTPHGGVLPSENVLHYEEFKHPNGTKLLFAFTDRDIYFYDAVQGWLTCIDIDLFEGHTFNHWSTTQIVDQELGATIIAAGSWINSNQDIMTKGDERVMCYFDQVDGLFYKFDMKLQVPVVDEETGLSYPAANAASLSFQGLTLEILDTSKWAAFSTTEIKVSLTSNTSGVAYPTVVVEMKDATGTVTAILADAVEANLTLSGTTATTATNCDTVLSADAIAKQILKVINSAFGTTLTAQAKTQFKTAVSGLVTSGSALEFNSTVAGFDSIVPHTFTISLGTGEGVIAQAGTVIEQLPVGTAGALVDCYRLVPTNFEIAAYDTDCYVRVDGLGWQIKILRPSYAGASLLVNYDYLMASNYKPVHIATHRNCLMLGNTFEDATTYYPWRLRWSEAGTVSKIKFSAYQDFLQRKLSSIIGVKTLNTIINNEAAGFLYVHLNDFIYRGVPHETLFLNFEVAFMEGVMCPETILEADGMFFFMGNNDIYAFDGVTRKSITKKEGSEQTRVRSYIYSNLDYGNLDKNFAVYDTARRKLMFFLKFNSNEGTYPRDVAIYDLDAKLWYFYYVPETSTAISAKMVSATTPIAALRGTIDGLGTTAIQDLSESLPYTERIIAAMTKDTFTYAGGTYQDKLTDGVGTDIEGYILTRDFIGQSLENPDRTQRVQIESRSEPFTVGWNGDYSLEPAEFLNIDTMPETRKYKLVTYNPDVTHYHIRFMLKTVSKEFRLRWLQVYRMRQEITND